MKQFDRPSALPSRATRISAAFLMLVAGFFRWQASLGDFWLDEAWSWALAYNADSLWEILTQVRHDNNHFLNTGILFLLGPERDWWEYRLPAVLAGVGTMVLAGWSARGRETVDVLTAMFLVGSSYLCLHYSSEARGYAYVMFLSLLSFVLMERSLTDGSWGNNLLFAASAVCGFLAHLTFVSCYAALVAWSLFRLWKSPQGWAVLIRCHALPGLFVLWLYFTSIRDMEIGGGVVVPLGGLLVKTLSLSLGGPETGLLAFVVATTAAVALLAGLILLRKSGSDAWIFYASVTVVGPAMALLLTDRDGVYYVRYFLIAVLFFLLLLGQGLGRLYRAGSFGKAGYGLALMLMLWGNAHHIGQLLRLGRGSYQEALVMIQQQSRSFPITISSDHDGRNDFMIDFYRRRLSRRLPWEYVRQDQRQPRGSEWFLQHSFDVSKRPDPQYVDQFGNRYRLVREFRTAGLSGSHWFVYHNETKMTPGG